MKKFFKLLFVVIFSFSLLAGSVDAYVSVKGYYRKDGTYVRPHVRSNPNGLKYDNYSYTPSQGLYNSTYGTRGAYWDTPTYITDPYYYQGQALYNAGLGGTVPAISNYSSPIAISTTSVNTQLVNSLIGSVQNNEKTKNNIVVPKNASLNYWGDNWYCNSGYKTTYENYVKSGCEKIIVPQHASLSYSGSDWFCNSGYKTVYTNYIKSGCEEIKVPTNASLNFSGSDWICNSGYKTTYEGFVKKGCDKIVVPKNASLNYSGSDWFCNSGYKTTYRNYIKSGCERE